MPTVPKEYLGVWQRTLLETTAGVHDTTTPVCWLQTESLFCDVRAAPHAAAAPPPPAGPLSSCDEAQLHALAAGGGFAGHTVVSGDLCNWIREVDFQPPGGPPDIGKMRFETPTRLIEDDPEGSYHEVWEKLPESEGACWAFRLSQGSRKVTRFSRSHSLLSRRSPLLSPRRRSCAWLATAGCALQLLKDAVLHAVDVFCLLVTPLFAPRRLLPTALMRCRRCRPPRY